MVMLACGFVSQQQLLQTSLVLDYNQLSHSGRHIALLLWFIVADVQLLLVVQKPQQF